MSRIATASPDGLRLLRTDDIDGLYEAALGSIGWTEAISLIGRSFDATSGFLFTEHGSGRIELLGVPGWSDRALGLYADHWHLHDPYAAHARRHPADACFLGQEIVASAQFRESGIWQDFGRLELPAFHFIGVQRQVGDNTVRLAWHRPEDARPFDEADRAHLLAASCHLRRAMQIRTRLLHEENAAARNKTGCPEVAIIVTSGSRRLRYANPAAERLARSPSELRLYPDLQLRTRSANARLGRLLADAAQGGPGGGLVIRAAADTTRLAILVAPVPADRPDAIRTIGPTLPSSERSVLVMIRLLRPPLPLSAVALQGMFDLSRAEAEVTAALSEGASVEAIAGARGSSLLTVRTQVRQILAKTETRNLRCLALLLGTLQTY